MAGKSFEKLAEFHDLRTLGPLLAKSVLKNNLYFDDHQILETFASQLGTQKAFFAQLADALEKHGYRKLKLLNMSKQAVKEMPSLPREDDMMGAWYDWLEKYAVGTGGHSLVFETTENQLLRICPARHSPPTYNHPAILQPIASFNVPVMHDHHRHIFNVTIVPKVRTKGIRQKHLTKLLSALENEFNAPDIYGNIGLIDVPGKEEPVPVLIDSGHLSRRLGAQRDYTQLSDWLSPTQTKEHPHGIPWQNIYDPRIGTGKPTGVVDEKTLEKLEESRGTDSRIVKALKEGGYLEHVERALKFSKEIRAQTRGR